MPLNTPFRSLLMVSASVLMLVTAARAADADSSVTLDPANTQVTFELGATGHDVHGTLYLKEGHLELGADGQASGRLVINAVQTETGSKKRDKTLHAKVLESVAHPLISFTVKRFEGSLPDTGQGEITLHGRMNLVGQDHPMAMSIQVTVNGDRYSGSSQFDVPFVEWGLHDPSILFLRVEKVVKVSVETEGTLIQVSEGKQASEGEPTAAAKSHSTHGSEG